MSSEVHPGLVLLRHWCPDREKRHEWVRHACQEACNIIRGTGNDQRAQEGLIRLAHSLDWFQIEEPGVRIRDDDRYIIAEFIAEI